MIKTNEKRGDNSCDTQTRSLKKFVRATILWMWLDSMYTFRRREPITLAFVLSIMRNPVLSPYQLTSRCITVLAAEPVAM